MPLPVTVHITAHVAGVGDRKYGPLAVAGTPGEPRALEGFEITVSPDRGFGLQYVAFAAGKGWTGPAREGEFVGTREEGRQLEAFAIGLAGPGSRWYEIRYCARVQGHGDTRWHRAGEVCGVPGRRIEGIHVRLSPRPGRPLGRQELGDAWKAWTSTPPSPPPGGGGGAEGPGPEPDPRPAPTLPLASRVRLRSYHGHTLALPVAGPAHARPDAATPPGTPPLAGRTFTVVPEVVKQGEGYAIVPRIVPTPPVDETQAQPPVVTFPMDAREAGRGVVDDVTGRLPGVPGGVLPIDPGRPPIVAPLPPIAPGVPAPSPPPIDGKAPGAPRLDALVIVDADEPASTRPATFGDAVVLLAGALGALRVGPSGDVLPGGAPTDAAAAWTIIDAAGASSSEVEPYGLVALRSPDGKFLTAQPSGEVAADADRIGPWQRWTLEPAVDAPDLPGAGRGASAIVDGGFSRALADPASGLGALLDATPSVQGRAVEEMDGRKVPIVLAVVRDRAGATRAGMLVRLLHDRTLVDQARTDASGLVALRYPARLQAARGSLAAVEVQGAKDPPRQMLVEVPRDAQHALIEVVVDELPASGAPGDDPLQRLPADFSPELFDDVVRLAGQRRDVFAAAGAPGGPFGNGRSKLIKRLVVSRVGQKRARGVPAPRYLVTLRQEWVFLGCSLGPLEAVEGFAPGQRVDEVRQDLMSEVSRAEESAQDLLQEARQEAESTARQLSHLAARTQADLDVDSTTTVDARTRMDAETLGWAVGGSIGIVSGGAAGSQTSVEGQARTEARAALRSRALTTATTDASVEANSLTRTAQSTVNRQSARLSSTTRSLQTASRRALEMVSPLLSRATNLMRWQVLENYAVLTRVEDVKEVAAVRVARPTAGPLFRAEDIVEYARLFAPALLDRTLLPHFDLLRQQVQARQNATRPISRIRVTVDYAAPVVSAKLRVTVKGRSAVMQLRRGGSRASAVLSFPSPIAQSDLGDAEWTLVIGKDQDRPAILDQPFALLPGMRDQWEAVARAMEESAAQRARVDVSSFVIDYSTVRDASLQQHEDLGRELWVTREASAMRLRTRLQVPPPHVHVEHDPLFLHVNRNRTHYLGVLLQAALEDPSLRDDAPQLAAFPGDHDIWRLPILGFDGDRLMVVRDVDPRVPDVKRILEDPGAATIVQVASSGSYAEALQGVLALDDLKGKVPPALEPPVHVVPPGYAVLDLAKGAAPKDAGVLDGAPAGRKVPIDQAPDAGVADGLKGALPRS